MHKYTRKEAFEKKIETYEKEERENVNFCDGAANRI